MRSDHVSTRGSASATPVTRCDALEPAGGAIGADDEVSFVRDRTLADQPAYPPELRRNRLPTLGPSDADTGARALAASGGTSPSCGDSLRAFTVLVGGGMGKNHTNPDTFPRLADPLATVAPEELFEVLEAIVGVQRDNGNRSDRELARLKYLVNAWGIERFRATVEGRLGYSLPDAEPAVFAAADDHLGWHPQGDGRWLLGVKVDNGRIRRLPRSDALEQRQGALSR